MSPQFALSATPPSIAASLKCKLALLNTYILSIIWLEWFWPLTQDIKLPRLFRTSCERFQFKANFWLGWMQSLRDRRRRRINASSTGCPSIYITNYFTFATTFCGVCGKCDLWDLLLKHPLCDFGIKSASDFDHSVFLRETDKILVAGKSAEKTNFLFRFIISWITSGICYNISHSCLDSSSRIFV